MIASRHITKIVSALTALAVCFCLCAVAFSGALTASAESAGISMDYEKELFDTDSPITVNILMDDDQWEEMLASAIEEEYYQCDVEINGQTFYRVGIRPKGNTSLTSIASDPDTDRYSLKLEFDQYVDGQTCFGLDKLVLNNNYADATNRKEALVYDMYRYLGADASLCNYAEISVNGEYWGVYLALEAVEDSFMLRNFGAENGALYKPEGVNMGGGAGNRQENVQQAGEDPQEKADAQGAEAPQGNIPQMPEKPGFGQDEGAFQDNGDAPQGDEDVSQGEGWAQDGTPGGFVGKMEESGFGESGGADLNYTDDDLDSYSAIWDGEVTDTAKSDRQRVVAALKSVSEGSDLESCLDVDNLLKYMAVHVFSVNQDSLSGNMAHNYYLYEHEGRLNLFPWDYNLAFGGMGGGDDASSVINDPIDTPFAGTDFFDALLENEEYRSQYHQYLNQLVEEYVFGGGLDTFFERTANQIDTLIENDPTAFYTLEESQVASQMLRQIVELRGESIRGQLDGSIPSTEEGQREYPSALIDASSIDLSVMGTMNQNDRGRPDFTEEDIEPAAADPTEGGDAQEDTAAQTEGPGQMMEMGRGFNPSAENVSPDMGNSSIVGNLITYGVCLVILALALLFVLLYRRKSVRR